jgi:hypothetical protein
MPTTPQYHARLISAGPVRTRLNRAGEVMVSRTAVFAAVRAGLFENLACFIDHSDGNPSVRDLLGVWHDVTWDAAAGAALGVLTAYENSETAPVLARLEALLAAAQDGRAAPDIGISLVFHPRWAAGGRVLDGFQHIESADLVFFPAANGRFLGRLAPLAPHKGTAHIMNDRTTLIAHEEDEPVGSARLIAPTAPDKSGTTNLPVGSARFIAPAAPDKSGTTNLPVGSARFIAPAAPDESGTTNLPVAPDIETAVLSALRQARAELQALDDTAVIDLGPRPAALSAAGPLERMQSHLDWFFGVPDAPTPPANLRRLDQLYVALTGDNAFHGVFRPEQVQFAAATTTTLAGMAVNAMNKVIQAQFSNLSFWRWYEHIAWPVANDGSVQEMKFITFGGIGNLPTVAEGDPYTELTVDDQTETAVFSKKGGYVGLTLEMIRNSSIVQLQAVPRALAVAAVRTRSAAVSALFTANAGVGPTLATDSKALFHADHHNVATTAFDQTAWRAARAECFAHTEVHSGLKLAAFPKYLLVPVDLYDSALSVFGYGDGQPTSYTPEAQARSAADPRPLPLVVPDWTDANNWAYVVDPQVYPVIQISYAQAPGGGRHPAPELFTAADETGGQLFTNDTLPIKVRDWFAVGVNGPRGIGKRNVA